MAVTAAAVVLLTPGYSSARVRTAAWTPVREAQTRGSISASLTYEKEVDSYGLTTYRNASLEVRQGGRVVFMGAICRTANSECGPAYHGGLSLRNVWASAEPEVVVDLFTGGAHCCVVSAIILRQDGHARLVEHDWASDGYQGQYHGGAYYFVSGDDRFDYEFTDYADSRVPIAVWSFNGVGHLVDVTRKRLDLVRGNAQRLYAWYVSHQAQQDSDVRGVLAAWCADEYTLGDGDTCDSELLNALQTGLLQRPALSVGPTGQAYVSLLRKDFLRWGYSG